MSLRFTIDQQTPKCLIRAVAIFFLLSTSVAAQTQSSGATDNGVTAGFSSTNSGEFPVSGVDSVNFYNGHVSLNLNIGRIGARGSANYAPSISISRTFVLRPFQYWFPAGSSGTWSQQQFKVISEGYNDSYDYSNRQPGFLPAIIIGRKTRDNNPSASGTIPPGGASCSALTKLYLRLPGGEIELRDATGWNGEPHSNGDGTTLNRGKLWHSLDGSQMLFVSDSDIVDETCEDRDFPAMNGINVFNPTGYLLMPDGSRYRFVQGQPIWLSDRNGNTLTFTGPQGGTDVTDSIGRKYQFSGGVTYKDHGGLDKTVAVIAGNLSTALRSDFAAAGVKTLETLFPGVYLEGPTQPFNPSVTKTVHLPNGLAYHFFYTAYGELARIEMPSGGIIEYDYAAAVISGSSTRPQLYRPATARRVYDSPGHLQSRQTFVYDYNTYGITVTSIKTYDAADTVVGYERHTFKGTVFNDFQFSGWYQSFDNGREITLEFLDSTGNSILRRIDNTWQTLDINGNPTTPPQYTATHPTNLDCALTEVKTTLPDTGQISKTTFAYDSEGNKTDTYDYDFGTGGSGSVGALLRRTHFDFNHDPGYVQTSGPRYLNLVVRKWTSSDASGTNKLAQTEFEYDNYGSYPQVDRPNISGSCIRLNDDATSCLQASDSSYTKRGNLTKSTAYFDIANNGLVTTMFQYDIAGNIVKEIDGRGYPTTFEYLDSFGPPDGNARGNSGSQELNGAGKYSYAFATMVTNALGHTTYTQFNYYVGKPVDVESANGNVATRYYNDVLDRITQVSWPDGGRTTYTYVDVHQCGSYVETRNLLDSTGRETDFFQFFDALGRPYRTFNYENQDTNNPYITIDTQYNALGMTSRVSSPYRSSGCTTGINPLGRWTTVAYDTLGRMSSVTTPDGASVTYLPYSGNTVTITDQHAAGSPGHQRRDVTDPLGRLVRVDEPDTNGNLGSVASPNQATSYTYDGIGNLRRIAQGTQQRFFMYDALGRLIRNKTAEQGNFTPDSPNGFPALTDTSSGTSNSQWSIGYIYDANGNLTKRRDARDVMTTYEYDALNRNKTVRYTDGTKNIDRFYDGAINGKGRLWYSNWNATDNSGYDTHLAIDQYDAMGRPVKYRQHFYSNAVLGPQFNTTRTYDKAGHVASQTYPSGHTVNYNYDIAGRIFSDTGNLGDGVTRTYATGITYSEFGGLQQEQLGTQVPLFHKLHYNVRGQLYDVRLSTLSLQANEFDWNRGCLAFYYGGYAWGQSGPANNGDLTRQEHYAPADDGYSNYWYTQDSYGYDSLNRLGSTSELHGGPWGQSGQDYQQVYNYDRFGNRTIHQSQTTTNVPHPNYTADPNTNRLIAPSGYSYTYDNAGNQTYDDYTGAGTRSYDAENRMKQAWANNQWQTYTYDADGRRIKRNVNGAEVWQLYGMDGELLAEYQAGAAPFLPTQEYVYRDGELITTIASGNPQRLSRFVTNLYYGALQVDPTSQQLQDKINQLAAAGAQGQSQLLTTASQIARSLFTQTNYETSSPARSDVQFVSDLYYTYLQRAPDDGGLTFWAGQAAGSRVNVCNAFEASGEFQALVATLYGTAASDNERTDQLINNFYLGARGTSATSTELQQQRDALNVAAAQGLGQVQAQAEAFGRSLFTTQVNDASLSNAQYVTNLYEAFLQRGPDAGGLAFWSGQASVGQGRQNVLGSFATCGPFRELAGTLYREAYWLVADHLGTPRMIVNKSGSLASVKRHDYLPFGEEIGGPQVALIGGRTTTQGYAGDGVRQKFTKKERDIETGLDYFGSRYYSSQQGRFSSPDHFRGNPASLYRGSDQSSALPFSSPGDPQTLNAYAYVYNNPLSYHDPDGHRGTRHYKQVPGSRRYTYRADISNLNDSPNLHIFDRRGTEIGRVAIKGDLDNPRFEWESTSTVPESVKANVEALITEQIGKGKWLPRPSLWQEETPSGTSGTGGLARVNAALMFLHIFLEAYNTYYDEKHYGYSYDMMGKIIISDLALAKQYLPTGFYEIEGYLFHFANGKFTSVDERCRECTVESDYPGDLHVKHPVVQVRPKSETDRERKNGYRQRV